MTSIPVLIRAGVRIGLAVVGALCGGPLLADDLPAAAGDASWTIVIRPLPAESGPVAGVAAVPALPTVPAPPVPPPPYTEPAETPGAGAAPQSGLPGDALPMELLSPFGPRMSYVVAYDQIPFNRSEYEANPSYRHDAALELMFGQLRPTTIMRQTSPYFSRYPDFFRYRYPVYPYPPTGFGALPHPVLRPGVYAW